MKLIAKAEVACPAVFPYGEHVAAAAAQHAYKIYLHGLINRSGEAA